MTYLFTLKSITTIKIMNISLTPRNVLMSCCNPYPPITSVPAHTPICFLLLWISFLFLEFYVDGIMWSLLFVHQALLFTINCHMY